VIVSLSVHHSGEDEHNYVNFMTVLLRKECEETTTVTFGNSEEFCGEFWHTYVVDPISIAVFGCVTSRSLLGVVSGWNWSRWVHPKSARPPGFTTQKTKTDIFTAVTTLNHRSLAQTKTWIATETYSPCTYTASANQRPETLLRPF
jgi:hypothetical protein